MTNCQLLDLYFLDARSHLLELAAFLDRLDRSRGESNSRTAALKAGIRELSSQSPDRAERILNVLSDPTSEPVTTAGTKLASGARLSK
jgi:hypothetical protein